MFEFLKKNKCKNENLYKTVVETVRSSLDIKITKKNIINIIGKALNADRCFIMEYDKTQDRFKEATEEYLSSPELLSYKGVDLNDRIPHFIAEFKKGKTLIFNQSGLKIDGEDVDINNGTFEIEKKEIETYKVYSGVVFPISYSGKLLGELVVHYIDKKHNVGKDETDILKMVSGQLAIALHQANLYQRFQKNAEQERLLFDVTEKTRASLDIEEILSFICCEITKIFNVQRAAIASFIEANNYEKFMIRKEYKLSSELKGYSNEKNFRKAAHYVTQEVIKNGIISINNIEKSDTPDIFKTTYLNMGIKSIIGVAIKKDENIWGILMLSEYNNYRNWSNDEKTLLSIISNQIYIAINQAELYQTVQNTAQNEKILRDIMLSFVKTLEMEELIKNIVTQIGKLFKADRCFFIESNSKTNSNLPVKEYAEYLSSPNIISHTKRAPLKEETGVFILSSKQQKVIFAENINKVELPEPTRKMLADDLSVKSYLIAPVHYGETRYGGIVLHYVVEYKKFTEEEINIVMAIANQAAIVIHQAKLYQKIKRQSEKEKLLREITESIRSSIDMETTKQSIVNTIGKTLDADRCFIIEYDKAEDIFMDVKNEYLSSNNIISFSGINPHIEFPVFATAIKKGKTLLIQNEVIMLNFEDQDFSVEKQSLQKYGLNSGYALPLHYKDELLGIIAVHYLKENRIVTDEEIDLLNSISSQIAIALHQSKLYNATLIYAERERISKNIIEILRSSIDKTIIKKLFVKNIGKFLDADRVFLSEYNSDEKKFMPIDKDSEYLSSPSETSFIGIDWSQNCIKEYYQAVQEKREIKVFSMDEYIKDKELECNIKNLIEKAKIKSSYSFPIFYQDQLLGSFCIDFTQKNIKLSDEDINRIRNMCTQAGIALYHAALYEKAQQCFKSRKSFITEYSEKIKKPVDEILDTSTLLSQNEFERKAQVEYLNAIINACNQLIELTKNFSED